jgi:hypothetical protein
MRKESFRLTATIVTLAMVSACAKPGEALATPTTLLDQVPLSTPYFTPVPYSLPTNDPAAEFQNSFVSLEEFTAQVEDGTDFIRGLYVKDKFTLRVSQQPEGDFGYITLLSGEVSQFGLAEINGVIGLLGHVQLVGKDFSKVFEGQEMSVVFGNRKTKMFRVTEILRFQAYSPDSPYSDFIQVDRNNQIIGGTFVSANDLFLRIYTGNRLVLQTCIDGNEEAAGGETWGRLFIIAEPVDE